MTVADLAASLDPVVAGAADWDPVGLTLGDPDAEVGTIGVCHEVSHGVIAAALAAGVTTLVAYHPLLFRPTTRVVAGPDAGGRAHRLVANGISLVVVHTGWDVWPGGTGEALAEALGVHVDGTFAAVSDDPDASGLGRVGDLDETTSLGTLADHATAVLGAVAVRVAGDRSAAVRRIAVLPGSGSDAIGEVAALAHVLVTGDVAHHRAVGALDAGLAIVDVGHAPSERPGMAALVRWVGDLGPDPVVDLTDIPTSPWEGR